MRTVRPSRGKADNPTGSRKPLIAIGSPCVDFHHGRACRHTPTTRPKIRLQSHLLIGVTLESSVEALYLRCVHSRARGSQGLPMTGSRHSGETLEQVSHRRLQSAAVLGAVRVLRFAKPASRRLRRPGLRLRATAFPLRGAMADGGARGSGSGGLHPPVCRICPHPFGSRLTACPRQPLSRENPHLNQ